MVITATGSNKRGCGPGTRSLSARRLYNSPGRISPQNIKPKKAEKHHHEIAEPPSKVQANKLLGVRSPSKTTSGIGARDLVGLNKRQDSIESQAALSFPW